VSDLNSQHNRVVWFDIPVADLARAARFYAAVLAIEVHRQDIPGGAFCVLAHQEGNGGCLVVAPQHISSSGVLVYLNAEGRLRAAVGEVTRHGGTIVEPIHPIGPHGFRAIVTDSEGNRVALHASTDG
jgi:predicted enzyme related to lactoylglutathione lyase